MSEQNAEFIAAEWLAAKKVEADAVAYRRDLEDRMLSLYGIAENVEGTQTMEAGKYKIKVSSRLNKRVDADALQQIAIDNGTFDHLQSLFRWKAEINKKQWDLTDASITQPLTAAITTTPGRPSIQIINTEEK